MNTFTLGLLAIVFISADYAFPHNNPDPNFASTSDSLAELTNTLLESADLWSPASQLDAHPAADSGSVTIEGITVNSTLVAQIMSALQNVAVSGAVASGNLVLAVKNTTIAVGGLNSTLVLTAANATVLTAAVNSSMSVVAQNATVYAATANSSVNTVSVNSNVYEAVLNSSARLMAINSAVLLAAKGSIVEVTAVNSTLLIANQSSVVTVRTFKGSNVTYVGVSQDAVGNNLYRSDAELSPIQLVPVNVFANSCQATEKIEQFWSVLEGLTDDEARSEFEKLA